MLLYNNIAIFFLAGMLRKNMSFLLGTFSNNIVLLKSFTSSMIANCFL